MRTHEQLKKTALSRPGVKKEYDSLNEEFQMLEQMINARIKAGKTQREVAKKMKTTTSVVGRLETGGGAHRHSPTVDSLRRYARAINCVLEVKFVPQSKRVTYKSSLHKSAHATARSATKKHA